MNNGFTGIDINAVHYQANQFINVGTKACDCLNEACYSFMGDLERNWASPKAVEFSKNFNIRMTELQGSLVSLIKYKIKGVNDAARALATSNGSDWSDRIWDARDIVASNNHYGVCAEKYNGITGMATENVRVLFAIFSSKMRMAISMLEDAPRTIGFYSTDGSLITQYSLGVENMINEFRIALSEVSRALNACIETEAENILLGKGRAEESLRG